MRPYGIRNGSLGSQQVVSKPGLVLNIRLVPKHSERNQSWFEGRLDETLFERRVVGLMCTQSLIMSHIG